MGAGEYDFQKAICDRYDGTPGATLRTALGETSSVKKFWAQQAPAGTKEPYITFTYPAGTVSGSMREDVDEPMLDFHIWTDDYGEAAGQQTIAPALIALYADQYLALDDGGHVMKAQRTTPALFTKDPDKGYHGVVSFHFMHD